jgi:hypothetical protein
MTNKAASVVPKKKHKPAVRMSVAEAFVSASPRQALRAALQKGILPVDMVSRWFLEAAPIVEKSEAAHIRPVTKTKTSTAVAATATESAETGKAA